VKRAHNKKQPTPQVEAVYRQIGAKVEGIRGVLGITQAELASRCGLERASIANLETGRQRCPLHVIENIARGLGTTPKNLMRGIWT